MSDREIDELSGVETTGHEWDGIKELNNPLPRWWLWTMYGTIAFSIGYMIYFPAVPYFDGVSGRTTRGDLNAELTTVAEQKAEIEQRIVELPLEEIQGDEELFRYAFAGGQSNYKVFCSQCHGTGAEGGPGYPNLNDDDWIWGGDLEAIYTTIAHGVRNEISFEARFSDMPAFGDILSTEEIDAVAHHVMTISGQEADPTLAAAGAEVFLDNCSACHGEAGEGIRELGAPRLSDSLWLYGGELAQIRSQIRAPQHGVMPPWLDKLGDGTVKQLAVYIHSLGGGEAAPEE